MLEDLDTIDWASLTDAYGPATNIPLFLRDLTSNDPEDWVAAIDELYMGICHQQCTIYEVTPYVVPFLVELLGSSEVRCRARILELLGDIARATSYLEAHGDFSSAEDPRVTEESREQLATEMDWVDRSRKAVWHGLDVYLGLLSDFDPRLRISVPYTLGLLVMYARLEMPEDVGASNPIARISDVMTRHLDEEPNELVRASLVFGLGALMPEHPANLATLRSLLDPGSSPQVRLAAALSISKATRDVPDEAIRVLIDALEHYPDTDQLFDSDRPGIEDKHHPLFKAYRQSGHPLGEGSGNGFDPDDLGADEDFRFPWLEGWTRFRVIDCLCRLGEEHTERILPALLKALSAENPFTVESVSAPILRHVFGGQDLPDGATTADLSPQQREVLKVIYDNPLLWATNIGNVESVFGKIGLPETRADWGELLKIEEGSMTEEQVEEILATILRFSLGLKIGEPLDRHQYDRVRSLNLCEIGSDDFIPLLARFPNLEKLDIGPSRLTDDGLAVLPVLATLRELSICGTGITDAGVARLSRLSSLKSLNLSTISITDLALRHLEPMKDLKSLWLYNTAVSDAAIGRIRSLKPGLNVKK